MSDECDPMKCDCRDWASEDIRRRMLGNGHHEHCKHFKPGVGAIALLGKLVDGIKWWADQEDGIPEELWDAYSQACFISKGYMPKAEVPS
jgi:hypothetical protein